MLAKKILYKIEEVNSKIRKNDSFATLQDSLDDSSEITYAPTFVMGEILQKRRKELKLKYSKISEDLKIRSVYIEALEKGDHENLPEHTYTVGFLRSYLNYLGFTSEDFPSKYLEQQVRIVLSGHQDDYTKMVSEPIKDQGTPNNRLVIWGLISLVLLLVFYYSNFSKRSLEVVVEDKIVKPLILPEVKIPEASANNKSIILGRKRKKKKNKIIDSKNFTYDIISASVNKINKINVH